MSLQTDGLVRGRKALDTGHRSCPGGRSHPRPPFLTWLGEPVDGARFLVTSKLTRLNSTAKLQGSTELENQSQGGFNRIKVIDLASPPSPPAKAARSACFGRCLASAKRC